MKVFVAGASGRSGTHAVNQALEKGLQVRAGVKSVENNMGKDWARNDNTQLVRADLTGTTESLRNAIGDADAVICAVGSSSQCSEDYEEVDKKGVIKLIDAAKQAGVKKFVLQTSILTNGRAMGKAHNLVFKRLNDDAGALDKKLETEKYLKSSGLEYVIVRPGCLKDKPESQVGNLIMKGEDELLGGTSDPRFISRETVGKVLVESLFQPAAKNRVVEIVASPEAAPVPSSQWF